MSPLPSGLPCNPARDEVVAILRSLVPPPNFRVVLDVDPETELLVLSVRKSDPWILRMFGLPVLRSTPDWRSDYLVQRKMTSRTYAGLLVQLKETPEFLEFELIVEGSLRYREAVPLSL